MDAADDGPQLVWRLVYFPQEVDRLVPRIVWVPPKRLVGIVAYGLSAAGFPQSPVHSSRYARCGVGWVSAVGDDAAEMFFALRDVGVPWHDHASSAFLMMMMGSCRFLIASLLCCQVLHQEVSFALLKFVQRRRDF